MDNLECNRLFSKLSTALIVDACVRLKLMIRSAPPGLAAILPGSKIAGRALPVKHKGSVDVFLEAMEKANPGDILCIDNGGRMDEACIGDLTVLESQAYGMAGILVWGCHRDTEALKRVGLPVFSYGKYSVGPQSVELTHGSLIGSASFGDIEVTMEDFLFADADGAIFVYLDHVKDVLAIAMQIAATESQIVQDVGKGINLHTQFKFDDFLEQRSQDPSYTFREHLRSIGKSIEE